MAFNISVKSEPQGIAKGQFQGQIADDGLTLTKRKQEIRIPAGSETEYAGGNPIKVRLPDCLLDLRVGKFGSLQNRLAKDLAAYLSGSGKPPYLSDYSLPWYFYAISLLPIGIPIMTLGGAVPGMIGFGLCAGCMSIAQKEEWSTPVRLLVMGGLVSLGYIGFFVIAVIIALSQAT